jgi:thioester reductase-like protein
MNILLTGGTGFVGGFLAVELLKSGHFVSFLARPNRNLSAEKKVQAVLKFVAPDLHESFRPVYRVIEGDITSENLGLSTPDQKYLIKNGPELVLHGAASVDFAEANGHATGRINVDGTRNVLALAEKLEVKQFCHLSTLYVAGDRKGTILESELEKGQSFHNVYEQTKLIAETLVHRWHGMTGIPFSIYRLPVVIGNSTTGKALSYTGFYGFFKAFWGLA